MYLSFWILDDKGDIGEDVVLLQLQSGLQICMDLDRIQHFQKALDMDLNFDPEVQDATFSAKLQIFFDFFSL